MHETISEEPVMDKLEIQEKLIDILAKHTTIERSAVTPDKHLKFDLGLDSLDVAEMVYEIEETFGITIADEAADKIQKISDTVEFIYQRVQSPSEGTLDTEAH
jgi:acyl carrier protein